MGWRIKTVIPGEPQNCCGSHWSQKKQIVQGRWSTGLFAFEKIVIKHVVSHQQSQKKPLGHWEGVKLLGLCKVYPNAKVWRINWDHRQKSNITSFSWVYGSNVFIPEIMSTNYPSLNMRASPTNCLFKEGCHLKKVASLAGNSIARVFLWESHCAVTDYTVTLCGRVCS